MCKLPNPNDIYPSAYKTTCYIKNVITAPNIIAGDYTYYDDPEDPTAFEQKAVLFNWPEFGDKLVIGKFCSIACGTQFIMGPANHRTSSVSAYPFHVFGGRWAESTPPHLDQLPRKGNTVIGNDVWFGRNCTVMPGVQIGDGAIIAAHSVVTKDVGPYCVVGGNPARFIKKRFDDELIELLLQLKWWDFSAEHLPELLPLLCDPDLEKVRRKLWQVLDAGESNQLGLSFESKLE